MKKSLCKLLAILLTISLSACSTPAETTTPTIPIAAVPAATVTPPISVTAIPAVVTFTDPVLEAMIRGAIGQPEGGITLTQAQAVTRLDLNDDLQGYLSQEPPIENISGLEAFTNLENLDLSSHAVTDISSLQGLTKLASLSLAGNPVADVSPLAGLTNLKLLILSGSKAQDYSALSNLVNLQVLMLDNSTISDLSPLAGLTNLRHLNLAKSSANDYSPLETIYPGLENKDFIIATTLAELGFNLDYNSHQAFYDSESASFIIQHAEWGLPQFEWDANIIRINMYMESGHKVSLGYYGDLDAYVFMMGKDGEQPVNYVYDVRIR